MFNGWGGDASRILLLTLLPVYLSNQSRPAPLSTAGIAGVLVAAEGRSLDPLPVSTTDREGESRGGGRAASKHPPHIMQPPAAAAAGIGPSVDHLGAGGSGTLHDGEGHTTEAAPGWTHFGTRRPAGLVPGGVAPGTIQLVGLAPGGVAPGTIRPVEVAPGTIPAVEVALQLGVSSEGVDECSPEQSVEGGEAQSASVVVNEGYVFALPDLVLLGPLTGQPRLAFKGEGPATTLLNVGFSASSMQEFRHVTVPYDIWSHVTLPFNVRLSIMSLNQVIHHDIPWYG